MSEKTLASLTRDITNRTANWMKDANWSLTDWTVAMMGEAGEFCNLVKKNNRLNAGIKDYKGETFEQIQAKMKDELADTFVYLILVAKAAQIDLEAAIIDKFNRDSEARGLPERM